MAAARSVDTPDIREQLIAGALRLIGDEGPADLGVRRLAQAGHRSTMCVYTKFTSRQGMLAAVYERAASEFLAHLDGPAKDGMATLAEAYRARAATSPGMYSFLFEQYPASLELPPALRAKLIDDVCALVAKSLDADRDEATAVWATMHGLVTLQQTSPAGDLAGGRKRWPARFLELLHLGTRRPARR